MTRFRRATLLLAATTLTLSACGGESTPAESTGQVPASAPYNDADVRFATEMIPHHAQALIMVDMATGRDVSPEMTALLEQIRAAQAPEIEEMTDLLQEWEQPVPDNPRDHGGMDHDEAGGTADMPGMMDPEETEQLEGMSGPGFEQRWLEMMIGHHESAVELSERETADGEATDAIALAEDIVASQTAEIEQMRSMLDG